MDPAYGPCAHNQPWAEARRPDGVEIYEVDADGETHYGLTLDP